MKLVISGYYGFNNVGDEAILYAIVQTLKKQRPDIQITVLSNNPGQTALFRFSQSFANDRQRL